ncbi:MAG: hypothetical protein PHP00_10975 [Thiotrichaceae bacterium]|nr:hypothetical protein [Thiotrichaceae bacterium]
MLNITAIRITTYTAQGSFIFETDFRTGLNIIRGDNAKGKSTLVQSIFYALGQEELLGGKNSKVMQSCLRKQIRDDEDNEITVHGSSIELQISNGVNEVTLKRSVSLGDKDDRLIEVIFGAALSDKTVVFKKEPKYLHDAGGATNPEYGFHKWLEDFLGWELPSIYSFGEKETKLYCQLVFPAFLIEQKLGWSNYLATSPYFSIKNPKKRAIEFLLQLDISEFERKKRAYEAKLEEYKKMWQSIYDEIRYMVSSNSIDIEGINRSPHVDFNSNNANLIVKKETQYTLLNYIEHMKQILQIKQSVDIPTNAEANVHLRQKLEETQQELQNLVDEEEQLQGSLSIEHIQKKEITGSLQEIEKDIEKNEGALKVQKFGADNLDSCMAHDICPTCKQEIKDALLPLDIHAIPMDITDNIKYIKEQKKIFSAYIDSINNTMILIRNSLKSNRKFQEEKIEEIKNIRVQLIADPRLPSLIEIREQIRLEEEIKKLQGYLEFFNEKLLKISELSEKYNLECAEYKNLPKKGLSEKDKEKLHSFTLIFTALLNKFNFQSCSIKHIRISEETYFPIIDSLELLNETLRNDSSGSDFTRVMWAYTLGLYLTSKEYNANHPAFILLDEPSQHSISNKSTWQLFNYLSQLSCQTIVADSFNNSNQVFEETTHNINCHLIKFEGRLLKNLANRGL